MGIGLEVGPGKDLAGLDKFVLDGLEVVSHVDLALRGGVSRRQEGGVQDTVFDIFEYYLDQKLKWTETSYNGSVRIDEKESLRPSGSCARSESDTPSRPVLASSSA